MWFPIAHHCDHFISQKTLNNTYDVTYCFSSFFCSVNLSQAFKSNNYDNQFFICHLSCAFNYQKVKVQVYVNTLRLEMTTKRRTAIIGSYEKPFKCTLATHTPLNSY